MLEDMWDGLRNTEDDVVDILRGEGKVCFGVCGCFFGGRVWLDEMSFEWGVVLKFF